MRRILVSVAAGAAIAIAACAVPVPAYSQNVAPSLEEGGTDWTLKKRKNAWTLGVVGGLRSGTYMQFVDELAKALDDGDEFRVLPIVSYGAASNVEDLLYLQGVSAALVQADAFEFFRNERKIPNLEQRIQYVIRLPTAEVHILARTEYKSLEDLRGKKVSFGPQGAGSSLTGPIIFHRLGIKVEPVYLNAPAGLKQVKDGEIAAMVRMVMKPIDFFAKLPADSGLHLLPVPFSNKFTDYYTLGEFTHEDYPPLVPAGKRVDTLGVPLALAVFNFGEGGDRHRRLERFVQRLFTNWEKLQKPPYHKKWRDVNLAATVPGWTRYFEAERALQQIMGTQKQRDQEVEGLRVQFRAFMEMKGASAVPRNDAQRDLLFREFMAWLKQKDG